MLACAFSVLAVALVPQGAAAGSVSGTVVDARRAPVPGATVRLFAPAPGPPLEGVTDLDGAFAFSGLPGSPYRLVVEMTAFESVTLEAVDPSAAASRTLVVTLRRPAAAPAAPPPASAEARPAGPARGEGARGGNGSRNGEGRGGFQEVGVAGFGGAGAPAEPIASAAEAAPATREDNSDLLLISGSSSASIDAGDWNDPRFRERMTEMADRMGFGVMNAGGPPGAGPGGFGPFGGGGGFGGRGMAMGGPGGGLGGGGGGGFGGGPMGGGFGGFGGRGRGMQQPRLNGSLMSTYRNSLFNARPYSLTGDELAKPLQIGDTFGAAAGGPLPWGGSSAAAATTGGRGGGGGRGGMGQQPGMWFFSYEGSRNRDPFDVLTTVPTALERAGDFSQTSLRAGPLAGQSLALYDPLGAPGTLFPGGRIPASRSDPAAAALLAYIPLPNLPGAVQNYAQRRGTPSGSDAFSGRINTRLSPKDNVFASYSLRTSDATSSGIFPGLDTDRSSRSQNVMLGGMHRFQARSFVTYRLSFNRVRTLSSNAFAFNRDVAGQLGIQGVSRDPINYGLPAIGFTNYGDLQLGSPSLTRNQTLTAGGGFNRFFGRHSIQSGGNVSWNQRNSRVDPNARGRFDFTGFATSAFDAAGRPIGGTGYDLADFLLGLPYETSRRFGSSNNYLRNRSFNLFVQDNWRVRSNLTVNYGLRYEYVQPFWEKYDRIVGLDVAPGFAAVAQVFPGQNGLYSGAFPRSLVFADRNNFAPRIGVAWKRTPTSHRVWRAGYGIFYNPPVYPYVYGQLVGQPPFAVSQDILTTLAAPLTLTRGFPADPAVTILNTYAIDPHYRIGYVQQWNLNLQTQLFRLYTLEVGYNASRGTRLDILRAPNRAPAGISPGSTEDRRTIADAGNFVYQQSGANSILHSMTLRLNRRFSRGLRLQGAYTLGKTIDNASGIGGGGLVVVQDERNLRGERALSSFDQRHRFDTLFNVDLPFGARRKYLASAPAFVDALAGGWSLNGSYTAASGTPLTARILGNVSNNSGTGSNMSERADATGAVVALPDGDRTSGRWFNTLAFTLPAPGRFGNASRNTIPGPGTNLLHLSLRKAFRLDDNNRRVEIRCQLSNVLNHPNFAGVGTVVNALDFGRVTRVGAMRQVEFQLRVAF